jgi:hypothetical protein
MYAPLSPFTTATYSPVSPRKGGAYIPISPKTNEFVYNPVSPKTNELVYNPVSPNEVRISTRRRVEYIDKENVVSSSGHIRPRRRIIHGGGSTYSEVKEGTFLYNILHPKPVVQKSRFAPVQNWESYLETMKLMNDKQLEELSKQIDKSIYDEHKSKLRRQYDIMKTTSEEAISRIRKQHEDFYRNVSPPPPPQPKEVINVPDSIDHVIVNTRVTESGEVKVKVHAPMAVIQEKYFSKCIRPPLKEYLKALKLFGYPDSVLEKVFKSYMNMEEEKKKMGEVIDNVFKKYNLSGKPTKPKKVPVSKSIMRVMKTWK